MSRLTSNLTISVLAALVLVLGVVIVFLGVQQYSDGKSDIRAKTEAVAKSSVQGTMTCSFVSDTSNTVTGGGNAVAAYVYPEWTASIPGASWIWKTYKVANPASTEAYTFNKAFYLTLPVTSASISVSSDNKHEVLMNGTSYFTGDSNWTAPANYTFPSNANFQDGANTLSVIGTNWGLNTTAELNPAAILYKFTVTATYCGTDAPPVTDQNVKLSLDLLLHGIGKAGDSVKEGAAGGGNTSPKHEPRQVRIEMFNNQNQKVKSVQASVKYDQTSGSFKGDVDMGVVLAGNYLVNAKFTQSLDTQIGGIQTIKGGTNVLPQQKMVTGDINNDGKVSLGVPGSLNILDFNILINCISGTNCSADQKIQADLDDNNKVDQFDFNLFIREITHITN